MNNRKLPPFGMHVSIIISVILKSIKSQAGFYLIPDNGTIRLGCIEETIRLVMNQYLTYAHVISDVIEWSHNLCCLLNVDAIKNAQPN
ncbi:hypothetical protein [Sporolactobacillus spathodeae]|uniref:Uncharacterized protein n=1 Tax=Sporolactobacillus spathodeae TaxID=1465502 RepID=A0ABS2Q8J9_9BACL|nr:hypothetical protein [Sporolactobacillus spathodeae]MBM7658109.1 hypothetical protein [Sporolactobacillus spathodeae]